MEARVGGLALLAVLGLALGVAGCSREPAASRPNLVLLVADDLGWTGPSSPALSAGHGSRYHETPNIDRLAAEGMSFTSAYAQQNCAPTRASLVAGQLPPRHGVYSVSFLGSVRAGIRHQTPIVVPPQRYDLDPGTVSVAEMLRSAGYRTAVVGKVRGFGPAEEVTANHGFDLDWSTPQVQLVATADGPANLHYFAAEVDGTWQLPSPRFAPFAAPYSADYVERNLVPFANGNDPREIVGTPKHLTDAMADAAIDVVSELSAGDAPFFLMVGFAAVHRPSTARPDLLAKHAARTSQDERHANPGFAALLEGLDQAVGRIVAALDELGDDTLVVFSSDNGGLLPETDNRPLAMGKGSFAEGGLRVPFIARQPGTIAPGSVRDEPVHAVDLYPTFAELAGATLPDPTAHPLDGESLASLLNGATDRLERDALYWHFPGYLDLRARPTSIVNGRVGEGRYKLTYLYEFDRYQLYDLSRDLGEEHDLLAGSPSARDQEIAGELSAKLRRWLIRIEAPLGHRRATRRPVAPPRAYRPAS